MEYFRLSQDQRNRHAILFNGLINLLSYQDIHSGNILGLEHMTPMILSPSEYNEYPDALSRQIFVVREPLKQVFDMFVPDLTYKILCAMDLPNRKRAYYYAPQLPSIECYSEQSDANLNRSAIHSLRLKKECIGDNDIFRVGGINEHVVIVTLGVAECILRRKLNGIRLNRVGFETPQKGRTTA